MERITNELYKENLVLVMTSITSVISAITELQVHLEFVSCRQTT